MFSSSHMAFGFRDRFSAPWHELRQGETPPAVPLSFGGMLASLHLVLFHLLSSRSCKCIFDVLDGRRFIRLVGSKNNGCRQAFARGRTAKHVKFVKFLKSHNCLRSGPLLRCC